MNLPCVGCGLDRPKEGLNQSRRRCAVVLDIAHSDNYENGAITIARYDRYLYDTSGSTYLNGEHGLCTK